MTEQEQARGALQEAFGKLDSEDRRIDFDLVKRCFDIELKYQFEKDRDVPLSRLSNAVAVAVEAQLDSNTAGRQ